MRVDNVKTVLKSALEEKLVSLDDSILAVCASNDEKEVFQNLGFNNITISNLDERLNYDSFSPYKFSFQNAENLTFEDGSFDFVFVSDGLHHCSSPHRALLEMYRVSKKGIIVTETRESLIMKTAVLLNLTSEYEIGAVIGNDYRYGGVNNTNVPNFVYRWTEREFIKSILSYNPTGNHKFRFYYGLSLPKRFYNDRPFLSSFLITFVIIFIKIITKVIKKQGNLITMIAMKPKIPGDLHPWLNIENNKITFNRNYSY